MIFLLLCHSVCIYLFLYHVVTSLSSIIIFDTDHGQTGLKETAAQEVFLTFFFLEDT
jgi:hypothetical protein